MKKFGFLTLFSGLFVGALMLSGCNSTVKQEIFSGENIDSQDFGTSTITTSHINNSVIEQPTIQTGNSNSLENLVAMTDIPDCAKNFDGRIVNGVEEPDALVDGNVVYYNNKFGFCITIGNIWPNAKIKTLSNGVSLINTHALDSYDINKIKEDLYELQEKYGKTEYNSDPELYIGSIYSYHIEDFDWEDHREVLDLRLEQGRNNTYAIVQTLSPTDIDYFYCLYHPDDQWCTLGTFVLDEYPEFNDELREKEVTEWNISHNKETTPKITVYNIK